MPANSSRSASLLRGLSSECLRSRLAEQCAQLPRRRRSPAPCSLAWRARVAAVGSGRGLSIWARRVDFREAGVAPGKSAIRKRNARLAPGKLAHLEAPGALAMNIEPTAMLGNSESVGQRFVTCDQHFAAGRGWPGGDYHIGSGESGVVTMRDSPFERAH